MNHIAHTFEALVYTVRTQPESCQANVHAVNLVSQLAVMPECKACVAIVCAKTFNRYVGLERSLYILRDYDVQLLQRWIKGKAAFFVFAELTSDIPDPYAGAEVLAIPQDKAKAEDIDKDDVLTFPELKAAA